MYWTHKQAVHYMAAQQHRTTMHTLIPKSNLEMHINLMCLFFVLWEKARGPRENPRKRLAERVSSPTFFFACKASGLIIAVPCSPIIISPIKLSSLVVLSVMPHGKPRVLPLWVDNHIIKQHCVSYIWWIKSAIR